MKFTIKQQDLSTFKLKARNFLTQYYQENELNGFTQRWKIVEQSITKQQTYRHTKAELAFGAKVAWRNSNRCIGRLFWKTLKVLDFRHIETKTEFVNCLKKHLSTAQAGSKIRSTISIFPPVLPNKDTPFKIFNYELLQYAGYQLDNGKVIGDPKHLQFTNYCQQLGWQSQGTAFDILPIVFQQDNHPPSYVEFPSSLIKEVCIEHPTLSWFGDLNLKWYNLPVVSNMRLEIGGISYPTAPFNGWYMLNEIATRNFCDKSRYNLLPIISTKMKLDKTSPFWNDKALLAINEAVYYSFKKAGITLVDHHTACEQFMQFTGKEVAAGRAVTGEWAWLVPPNSGSTTEVFHSTWDNTIKSPNFFHQPPLF